MSHGSLGLFGKILPHTVVAPHTARPLRPVYQFALANCLLFCIISSADTFFLKGVTMTTASTPKTVAVVGLSLIHI